MTTFLKYAAIALGIVVVLLLAGFGFVYFRSGQVLAQRFAVSPAAIVVPGDSATIARGAHLARAITKCHDCHGEDLGGRVFIDGMPFARIVAPNITQGQGGRPGYTDADFVRALRHGVTRDGRGLVLMPAEHYTHLYEADLAAIIAYVKSVPPVSRTLVPSSFGPIGRIVLVSDPAQLQTARKIQHEAPIPDSLPADTTAAYGAYLADVGGCTGCHGPDLKGSTEPGPGGSPPPADLTRTGRLGQWTEDDFRTALRNGVRPDGSLIDPFMPWRSAGLMTDTEIRAVWGYLKSR